MTDNEVEKVEDEVPVAEGDKVCVELTLPVVDPDDVNEDELVDEAVCVNVGEPVAVTDRDLVKEIETVGEIVTDGWVLDSLGECERDVEVVAVGNVVIELE